MAIVFDPAKCFTGYDRNYVKEVYAMKQTTGTTAIKQQNINGDLAVDEIVISAPVAGSSTYFNALAKDYLEGYITEAEFYSHLEDLYYAYGGDGEDATPQNNQRLYNWIASSAHNGILAYYLSQNTSEANCQGKDLSFYYNTDYHYQHLEQKERYMQGANALADKLGVNRIDSYFDNPITTVNGRMAVMLSCSAGKLGSLDEPPPPGMKIALYAKYEPYQAKLWCDGQEYSVSIPFSFDDLTYDFPLESLFSHFDIPEKYLAFIKNITVIHYDIARYDPNSHLRGIHSLDPKVARAIDCYDKNAMYDSVTPMIAERLDKYMQNNKYADK